jgi:oxalate decarboxylase/phosphoglucose isomerase-like protein (cupin superfamily)
MAGTNATLYQRTNPYDTWIGSIGVPIHKGYYIEDLRTIELGRWDERDCDAAFLQLAGQEGVTGAYVMEIAPGKTLPPMRMVFDEAIYVLKGRGITTVWNDGDPKRVFEWQSHSMFLIPGTCHWQVSNLQGNDVVRLLHCNYLPLAMAAVPNTDFLFKNPLSDSSRLASANGDVYSEAKVEFLPDAGRGGEGRNIWVGNFFPDMRAWDRLDTFKRRGAGGRVVWVGFPGSPISGHMSVFPARTYKKGHRHGPGYLIVIPAGEGYSIMWPEGGEKIVIPWREASAFVPPNRWFHQHFNVGGAPARYLAIHPPRGFNGISEKVEDRARDQIEYTDEDPSIRARFEAELGKRSLTSLMADEAYRNRDYEWSYT